MAYEIVFIDFDGTLADTLRDVAECMDEAFSQNGIGKVGVDRISQQIGKPLSEIIKGLLNNEDKDRVDGELVNAVSQSYKGLYAASPKPNTRLFPGMKELVDDLIGRGCRVVVHSNKPEPALIQLVNTLLPGRKLDVVGGVPNRPAKPDPSIVLNIMEGEKVGKNNAIYVGDTMVDVRTAENAGIDCAIVTWGQGDYDQLGKLGLQMYCKTSEDLAAILL